MGGSVTMRAALLFWTLVGAMSTWQPQLAAAPAPQNGIEGRWTAEQSADSGPAKDVTLSFERRGVSLGGSWQAGTDEMPLFDVREAGGNITFTLVIPGT